MKVHVVNSTTTCSDIHHLVFTVYNVLTNNESSLQKALNQVNFKHRVHHQLLKCSAVALAVTASVEIQEVAEFVQT